MKVEQSESAQAHKRGAKGDPAAADGRITRDASSAASSGRVDSEGDLKEKEEEEEEEEQPLRALSG